MEERVKRIKLWSLGQPQGPTQIQAHLTNFCNLQCFFCPTREFAKQHAFKKDSELNKDEWLDIIRQSKKMGVKEWHICGGGEPLLDRNLAFSVMTEIKKQGMIGEIITNGTLFDKQFIETLVKLKWDKVTISLDGPDAKTHEHIRKVKCFNKVIRNAKLFSDLKAEKGQKNPILAVHMVICNRNYDKICEMFKLAKQLNVDDVLVNALNIWSEEMEPLKMNKENWNIFSKLAKRALAYARKNNIGTNLDEFIQQNLFEKANIMDKETKKNINNDKKKNQAFNNILCFYPWFNMSIFSDGHIEPCFLFTTKGVDIRSAKSLEKVWNSKYFNRIRGTIIEDVLPKSCSRCNPWSFSINNEIRDCLNKKC